MHPLFIHVGNCVWILLILIGVPNITGLQFGKLFVSATPEFQMLTLGGFGIGLAANLFGGWMLRGNKQRRACWKWAGAHAVLLVINYLVFNGQIHFQWLKDALLWLKKIIGSF